MDNEVTSTNPFEIREGNPKDLTEVTKIWEQVINMHIEFDSMFTLDKDGISSFQLLIATAMTDSQQVLYVAHKGTEIVGFLYGFVKQYSGFFQKRLTAHVSDIAVKVDYQRNRIGSMLMDKFENEFALNQKADDISLNVHVQNHQGLMFYDKLGFERSLIRMRKILRND